MRKILIYISHPAQFHFYKNVIPVLKQNGNEVLILIKTKDVLEDLVRNEGFVYQNIQLSERKKKHLSIFFALCLRSLKILFISFKFKPDLLVGTDASVSIAGRILFKPSLTILEDDYDVIRNLANIAYPLTTAIVVPRVCDVGKWNSKKIPFDGYMKLAYLSPNYFEPDLNILQKYKIEGRYALIRISDLKAHHDFGISGLNEELIVNIVNMIEDSGIKVLFSTESKREHPLISERIIKIKPCDLHHILNFAGFLVSDSQSMSVEAAILGVPSIRINDLVGRISVLEELENKYELTYGFKSSDESSIYNQLEQFLSADFKSVFQARRQKMLAEKVDVTAFIVRLLQSFPK